MAKEFTAELKDESVMAFLAEINEFLFDFHKNRKLIARIGEIALKNVFKHFEEEKGPKGRWKPWSRIYRMHMLRIGKGGNKILQDTGKLRNSTRVNFKNERGKLSILINKARTRKGFPYAFAHDTGGPILPQREFMYLDNKALDNITEEFLQIMFEETF